MLGSAFADRSAHFRRRLDFFYGQPGLQGFAGMVLLQAGQTVGGQITAYLMIMHGMKLL